MSGSPGALTAGCLITSYNKGDFLAEAVASAIEQTAPFDEILVVDDGSTDGSADSAAKRFAGHDGLRFIRKPNGGHALVDFVFGDFSVAGEGRETIRLPHVGRTGVSGRTSWRCVAT